MLDDEHVTGDGAHLGGFYCGSQRGRSAGALGQQVVQPAVAAPDRLRGVTEHAALTETLNNCPDQPTTVTLAR
ncbi:hypothetical protein ACFZDJ_47440 [Streptomyces sp. NPDC007896]|uniref:hypothetical protein n=1 Tax=Streptomyces sp. NPDC007896 TaxID=3364784 RepID=UPI0036E8A0FA